MATEVLDCIMTAESDKADHAGDYYIYRKGRSYLIGSPLNKKHKCHPKVKNIDDVKLEINTVFDAVVINVKPRAFL